MIEGSGYGGTQVRLKILDKPELQMRLVSHGADIAGKACWREVNGRVQIELDIAVSKAEMGNGDHTIYITKYKNSNSRVFMQGRGDMQRLINHHYDLVGASK